MPPGLASAEPPVAESGEVQADVRPEEGTASAVSTDPSIASTPFTVTITGRNVEKYLGKVKFLENTFSREMKPGLAYGLAWTEMGGQLLLVEVAILEGKGELMLTGSLGDVMKESAQAALSFLRAHHAALGIPADFTKDRDIHVHVPEGAIPKDGPSAGITLTAALLSAVSGVTLKSGFAMTGEITLTGRLLPIGGVKEKVLAAHRYKMTHVLLPRRNEKDLEEIPPEVQQDIAFEFADSVLDAIAILFPEGSFSEGEVLDQSVVASQEDTEQPEPVTPADGVPLQQPSA
jgi:ATP-dependent Lon protease